MDSMDILQSVNGFMRDQAQGSADRPVRLAVIDPAYNPFANWPNAAPLPRVRFEGETTLSIKTYAVSNGYIPAPSDRVLMVPLGNTYQIMCKVHSPFGVQGFYQSSVGSASVYFGDESRYEENGGLEIDNVGHFTGRVDIDDDLDVDGRILLGPRGLQVPEFQMSTTTITGTAGALITRTINFGVSFPIGTTVYAMANIANTEGASGRAMVRASASTAAITLTILKTDDARGDFIASNSFTVNWLAYGRPTS